MDGKHVIWNYFSLLNALLWDAKMVDHKNKTAVTTKSTESGLWHYLLTSLKSIVKVTFVTIIYIFIHAIHEIANSRWLKSIFHPIFFFDVFVV